MLDQILPVLTLLLGAGLTYLTQRGADARQRRAAREATMLERSQARADRRETFELDHLLRLHEALMRLGRAAGRAHHQDSMVAKKTGVYASHQLPEEVSDELYVAGREVLGLMDLVLDNDLRTKVKIAHSAMSATSSLTKATVDEADALLLAGMEAQQQALSGIATRIRTIYLEEPS